MHARTFAWVAWPAFLAACVLQVAVFVLVDPHELSWFQGSQAWSRQAVYTAAFFVFWLTCMGACALTMLLRMAPDEVNQCPFEPAQRPAGCPGQIDLRDR